MTHPVGADGSWDAQRFEPDELMMYAPQWCGRIDMRGSTWMRNIDMPQAAARRRQMASVLQDRQHTAAGLPALQRARQTAFCLELLALWPHNFSGMLDAQRPALPRAVQRARDFVEEQLLRQPDEPLPVTALARATCVGVGALELAFRKHLGTTPLRYMHQRRLDGARNDLQARSANDMLRVVDVAEKWGFASPGQFARADRQRDGPLQGRHGRRPGRAVVRRWTDPIRAHEPCNSLQPGTRPRLPRQG